MECRSIFCDLLQNVIKRQIAAVSVGLIEGTPLLDLAYDEDVAADVDLNVVMSTGGQIVEVQGTAEKEPFSRAQLDSLLDLAEKGIDELIAYQSKLMPA